MISLAHRTIFVHVPKCGGQSVEEAFLDDFGLKWGPHRKLMFCMPKPDKDWPGRDHRLAHLRAGEYRGNYLPPEVFDGFYKFAVVRNPFRRAESFYRYTGMEEKMGFAEYILDRMPKATIQSPFLAPQAEYLTDSDGNLLVNDIFRLEDIATAWPEIQARSGVKSALPHRNKSAKRAALTWTDEMYASLAETYAADFKLLAYPTSPVEDANNRVF